MYQIENVCQLSFFLLQTPNTNLVNKTNPYSLWINFNNTLKPHQSNENDTKRLNLAMLPILCTLEPKFLKIGVTLLA